MPTSRLNKSARSAERKRLRNRATRSSVKTEIVKAEKLIRAKDESAREGTVAVTSRIDRAVSKGIFHRNKASRLKSRLMKKLNQTLKGSGD
jgi:small subunit ribosomal protein S20